MAAGRELGTELCDISIIYPVPAANSQLAEISQIGSNVVQQSHVQRSKIPDLFATGYLNTVDVIVVFLNSAAIQRSSIKTHVPASVQSNTVLLDRN